MNELESLIKSLTECWNVRMMLEQRLREAEAKIKELESGRQPG